MDINPNTTPTGIPITLCPTCDHRHPANRTRHCTECGWASQFIDRGGVCTTCRFDADTT